MAMFFLSLMAKLLNNLFPLRQQKVLVYKMALLLTKRVFMQHLKDAGNRFLDEGVLRPIPLTTRSHISFSNLFFIINIMY